MELSWLTEHACLGQSFKEESPLSATFNYFCILEGKKKRKGTLCLLSACISGGTVRWPSLWRDSCMCSWLLLNFRSAMMTSSLTCLQSLPDGGSSATPGVSSTQLGLKLPNSHAGISLTLCPCLLLWSRLTLLSLQVIVSSWSTLGFFVFRLTGTVPLLVGF